MSKKIIKQTFIIEIAVDSLNVSKKYPNYRFNFSKPEELIKSVANDIKFCADTDMSKDGMKLWGYSIKVKKVKTKK
jgi:hypothetical protein